MKFFKLILFIFILSYYSVSIAWYNYPYVCTSNNLTCYNTQVGEINKYDNGYFMAEPIMSEVSFSSHLNKKLNEYDKYYWDSKFTIKNFYNWNKAYDRELTFWDLISIDKEFSIVSNYSWKITILKKYSNWKEYFFDNLKPVIDELHSWFPYWDKKDSLSDILWNIVDYKQDSKNFLVKNVCDDFSKCTETRYFNIPYNTLSTFKLLSWKVKPNNQFVIDNFKVSDNYNISHIYLKSWWSANFNFWFEDYLDVWSLNTKYKYTISYKYKWDSIKELFSETIKISNDYKVSSDTITQPILNEIIDLKVLDNNYKKIRVWVKEWINLTKIWEITFYLSVENINTGDKFETTPINPNSPLYVIPNDEVTSWEGLIYWFSKLSNDNWYNVWDTFSVTLNLFDEYNNRHYDYIDWYDISLESWTSSFIELSKSWSDTYSNYLTWVKSMELDPYSINFKFRITKAWYHEINWFKLKIRKKQSSTSYINPPEYSFYNIVPSNLYNWSQKMKIYVKSALITDFPISCTSWSVTLKTLCTSDNFSWCNNSMSQSITFSNESQNGSTWILSIRDFAHNVKNFNYTMNHIDKTAPTISVFKWVNLLSGTTYKYKANEEPLKISFYEKTTSNCNSQINYLVKINWVTVNDSTPRSTFDYINNDFFTSSWNKELYIKATDKYWNFSEETINFTIFPDLVDFTKSSISVSSTWNKYANNVDNYLYTLILKDKYNNPIYNKNLVSINQDCNWNSWCNTIKTNMSDFSWDDALIEYSYSNPSDNSWKISFNLKSLSPWEFNNRFKISVKDWDDNYSNLSSIKDYYISNINKNIFKKPILWILNTTSWWDFPSLWKEQNYKVTFNNVGGLTSYSNWFVNISENSVVNDISGHFWKIFSIIDSSFGNDLSSGVSFKWKIDASSNVLKTPILKSNELFYISYTLSWKTIKYDLDEFKTWNWCDLETLWLKVYWIIQWSWNSNETWQESNFSDLSKSDIRAKIKNNAYNLIKNRQSWTIVNWVKYVEWNYTIESNPPFETLIVKNWNLIINQDLNISNSKLWIIVIKDNYNVYTDFDKDKFWNIYISSNVENINWLIYSDWAIRSAKADWTSYSDLDLTKKLKMSWALFSRNTIWWAVSIWWRYILPWWQNTSDLGLAEKYDLNYVRKVNSSCSSNPDDNYSFIIKYNSNIQANPPKWFSY